MTVHAVARNFSFCCGAVEIGSFGDYYGHSSDYRLSNQIKRNRHVFKIATFIDRPDQRKAYEQMCKQLKLVAQTEPKHNPRSGNLVFVAVFTNK